MSASIWCPRCGLRLSDGRCADCDAFDRHQTKATRMVRRAVEAVIGPIEGSDADADTAVAALVCHVLERARECNSDVVYVRATLDHTVHFFAARNDGNEERILTLDGESNAWFFVQTELIRLVRNSSNSDDPLDLSQMKGYESAKSGLLVELNTEERALILRISPNLP